MKKIFALTAVICALAGCTTPESITEPMSGIQYHKIPQCYNVRIAPTAIRRFNHQTGQYDIYMPGSNIYQTRCNYNPYYVTSLYGNGYNLSRAVYGGIN